MAVELDLSFSSVTQNMLAHDLKNRQIRGQKSLEIIDKYYLEATKNNSYLEAIKRFARVNYNRIHF